MTAVDPVAAAEPGRGIGYLPGLDGLRAVSVLAVIAYHLDLSWAPGGFLGVEVFFVVSGYLITLLALDEQRRTGAIDRVAFWGRRLRRLVPAVVALIGAVLAWTALVGADELPLVRGDALASLLYVQNWHAIVTEQPYFVSFGRPPPLRHLWSLAIEEQFYLLWPLVLPVALRQLGRRRTVILTGAAALLSVVLMSSLADIAAPERAYYGTDARAFGVLFGCLLAFGWRADRFRSEIDPGPRRTLGAIGGVALIALLWQFGHRSEFDPWTYPWGFALVDLCTVALVVTSTHPGSPLRAWLGARALAVIGKRSYSLYLWHWPVIVFTRPGVDWPLEGAPAFVGRMVLIAGLAELSYRFVEQPFRAGRAQPLIGAFVRSAPAVPRRALTLAAATVAVVGLLGVTISARQPEAAVAAGAAVTIADEPASGSTTPSLATTTVPTTSTTSSTASTAPPSTGAPVTSAPTTTSTPPPTTAPAPAPTTTAPPPVPGVTVVGESVTLGAAPELQRVYGARVQIDAAESRSFSAGVAVIESLAASGRLTPVVVVHMGNNGAVPDGALERIGAAVGPDRKLVFVNVRVPRRWEAQVNEALSGYVQAHENAVLGDWHALSGAEPGLITDDGVHLTAQGQKRYTDLVVAATG